MAGTTLSPSVSEKQEGTLSSRQKNIKRRQDRAKKRITESQIRDGSKQKKRNIENEKISMAKKQKVEEFGLYKANVSSEDDITDNSERSWGTLWPFKDFSDCLLNDLRHSKWEIRHGAATAIREIIIHHGSGGGKNTLATNKKQRELSNILWLKDTAKLLLCVVANDRFADFLSDQVVAPVRETSAMALGSVVKLLTADACYNVIDVLLDLLNQSEWQGRHGSVLAIKYFLMARPYSWCN